MVEGKREMMKFLKIKKIIKQKIHYYLTTCDQFTLKSHNFRAKHSTFHSFSVLGVGEWLNQMLLEKALLSSKHLLEMDDAF